MMKRLCFLSLLSVTLLGCATVQTIEPIPYIEVYWAMPAAEIVDNLTQRYGEPNAVAGPMHIWMGTGVIPDVPPHALVVRADSSGVQFVQLQFQLQSADHAEEVHQLFLNELLPDLSSDESPQCRDGVCVFQVSGSQTIVGVQLEDDNVVLVTFNELPR